MARHLLSVNCMFRFPRGYKSSQRLKHTCSGSSCTDASSLCVIHDRQNQRFTITLDCDGAASSAALKYTITHDQLVELMSTGGKVLLHTWRRLRWISLLKKI